MGPRAWPPWAPTGDLSRGTLAGGWATAPSITREADSHGLAVTVLIRARQGHSPLMCEVGLNRKETQALPRACVGPGWPVLCPREGVGLGEHGLSPFEPLPTGRKASWDGCPTKDCPWVSPVRHCGI